MTTIPKTMKALVAHNKDNYKLELAYPTPTLEEGEVLLKVELCGVCASDCKASHGAKMFWGDETSPSWVKAPFIPGHEVIGTVVQIAPGYAGELKLGDRVAVEQIVPCQKCRFCKTGNYWMCQVHDMNGFQKQVNGGMAEYMKLVKNALAYKIPDDMDVKKAILTEPYGCAKHAVDRAKITQEDVVVVSGAGPLGIGMTSYIRMMNPKKLIVLDLKEDRLDIAKKAGADLTINPSKEDFQSIIMELTDGYGCDIYIEATGHPKSVTQGLNAIRKLGTFVEFSVFGEDTTADWSIIGDRKELDLLGAHLSPYAFPPVIEWIHDGTLYTDGVVTHEFQLDDWKEAFDTNDRGENSLKVVLKP